MIRRTGHVLHIALEVLAGIVLLLVVAAGGLAWRLAQGPLDLPWLAHRISADFSPPAWHLRIGAASLVWEGWQRGTNQPLDIRLTDLRAVTDDGRLHASLPRATITLSPGWLLLGRLVPRAITLQEPLLRVRRAADGSLSFGLGDGATHAAMLPAPLLAELIRPAQTDHSVAVPGLTWLSQLRRLRIDRARLEVADARLGTVWSAPRADLDLRRAAGGGVNGDLALQLALGPARANLAAVVQLRPDGVASANGTLSPVSPAVLAQAAPGLMVPLVRKAGLARLAALAAPVGLRFDLDFASGLMLTGGHVVADIGAGQVHLGTSEVPLRAATIDLTARHLSGLALPPGATLRARLHATLPGQTHDPALDVAATLDSSQTGLAATMQVDLDQVDFTDLPVLWPQGFDHGVRRWVIENILAGTAKAAHLQLALSARPDFSGLKLDSVAGRMQGSGLVVRWLGARMPPITGGVASLRFDGPDALDITASQGALGALRLTKGRMHISGLAGDDQIGKIDLTIAGPLASALGLLQSPKLGLLAHRKMALPEATGNLTTALDVTVPLRDDVTMDQVKIDSSSRIADLRMPGLIAGHDLTQGDVTVRAGNDGATMQGNALLAGIAAKLSAALDFRSGGPDQVLLRTTASGDTDTAQLTRLGLDPQGVVSGPVALQAVWTQRREGPVGLAVTADLAAARMTLDPLGWTKPPGRRAMLEAALQLRPQGQILAIPQLSLQGSDGLSVQMSASATDGRLARLRITRARIGQSDFTGTVQLPPRSGGAFGLDLQGPVLDLSGRFTHRPVVPASKPAAQKPAAPPGPPWTLRGNFGQVLLAHQIDGGGLRITAASDGDRLTALNLQLAGPAQADLRITRDAKGVRQLSGSAKDAGALLRGLDLINDMQGGTLTLTGAYDDKLAGAPLSGIARIENFRIRQAPALARLLQAMTLYGLVEMVNGPGLGFTRLVAPFSLQGDSLTLSDARAFNQSLGLTAKGSLDLAAHRVDMSGTIVPAYFFNALLGGLPLVGKLFSPERGGGVFAATYAVSGTLADPRVVVNPLAALTPGFLRGLFDGF